MFQKYFAYKGSSLRDVTQKYLCGGHNTKIIYIIIQILRKGASMLPLLLPYDCSLKRLKAIK